MPPIDGLQDKVPRFSKVNVINNVLAPIRADAVDASIPALPPPIIITS